MNNTDDIYKQVRADLKPFEFDHQVAEVFEDMIQRSVPGYRDLVEQIGILAKHVVTPESNVYDLGCSLGAVTMAVRRRLTDKSIHVYAIDNSAAMIQRCNALIDAYHSDISVSLIEDDILNVDISNASLVVMNFTLQFIAQEHRENLINRIYNGMPVGGVLVLSEKLEDTNPRQNDLIRLLHEDFKRSQGYSELEISQKRDSLQNVLIPETTEVHIERLTTAGFSETSVWYKQYNFASFLAIK